MTAPATDVLRAPFPWFGGKSRAAPLLWRAFGPDVPNYIEPFAGSLAVLLGRPGAPRVETVNDVDAYLANFWRATQHAPAAVAAHADWPVNEVDLHARHAWLAAQEAFRARMLADPDYYDARVAGWWVWGLSQWIGSGWCDPARTYRRRPSLGGGGRGVHRTPRQMPAVDGLGGKGIHGPGAPDLQAWFAWLRARLRQVRVVCGDWTRVLTRAVLRLEYLTAVAVLLDPPYDEDLRVRGLYTHDGAGLSAPVRAWALAHGDHPRLRIALCGYEGEHAMPPTWRCVPWTAGGGYANAGAAPNANRRRERIWLSPHCLGADGPLFDRAPAAAEDAPA